MTVKVYCDMCGEEIHDKINSCTGEFRNTDGLLMSVTVTGPRGADLCKPCVIKIITDGEVFSKLGRQTSTNKSMHGKMVSG